MTQIYVDMDGVLADFDTHYFRTFSKQPSKWLDDVDWEKVKTHPTFYIDMPPMPDMMELWRFVTRIAPRPPIVLTGVPSSVVNAAMQKQAWGARWLGADVEIRCVFSKEKCLHANPGDILIDDWEKYRHLWEGKGGRWITHTSATDTIRQLEPLMEKLNA